jgi:UDP-3-O-[3-hydroxymyristoyl] glucosamine N-acyltransferase
MGWMMADKKQFCDRLKYGQHTFYDGTVSYAYQHKNPDGSLGGWVAETAYVADSCYMHPNSEVTEYAQVLDNVEMHDLALANGFAIVKENAKLLDWCRVTDNAIVCGDATVCGGTIVGGKSYIECGIVDEDKVYTGLIKKA